MHQAHEYSESLQFSPPRLKLPSGERRLPSWVKPVNSPIMPSVKSNLDAKGFFHLIFFRFSIDGGVGMMMMMIASLSNALVSAMYCSCQCFPPSRFISYRVFLKMDLHKRGEKMQEKMKITPQKDKDLVQVQHQCR